MNAADSTTICFRFISRYPPEFFLNARKDHPQHIVTNFACACTVLFVSQRDKRINAYRAARRQIASQHSYGDE